ncbi:MAG: hypothetical protein PHD21_02725 [Flavobacteriales bacterium]|nr:hypothetical protein [Flavobacteriales bacterium]
MKNRLFLLSIFLLGTVIVSHAQCRKDMFFDHTIGVQQRIYQLKDVVELTPEQIKDIVNLFQRGEAEYRTVLAMGLPVRQTEKMARKVVDGEVRGLHKIITPEQRSAYKKMEKKQHHFNDIQKKHQVKNAH